MVNPIENVAFNFRHTARTPIDHPLLKNSSIRFITPLLIHGANSGEADSIGLTGKALWGCWRLWLRALVILFVIPAVSKRESRIENLYG
jgi:hypothetical protein